MMMITCAARLRLQGWQSGTLGIQDHCWQPLVPKEFGEVAVDAPLRGLQWKYWPRCRVCREEDRFPAVQHAWDTCEHIGQMLEGVSSKSGDISCLSLAFERTEEMLSWSCQTEQIPTKLWGKTSTWGVIRDSAISNPNASETNLFPTKSPFFLAEITIFSRESNIFGREVTIFHREITIFPGTQRPIFEGWIVPPGLPVSRVLRQGEILGGIVERQRQRGAGGAGETPESCRRGCVFILDNIYIYDISG